MSGKYINKFQGRRVLIVGGSSGIGLGIAEGALEFGAQVIIASRTQDKVKKAVQQLKSTYPDRADKISGHTVNLAATDTEAQLQALFDFATNNGRDKLDHVVDTAGGFGVSPDLNIENVTAENIVNASSVRLTGTLLLAKFANSYLHKSYTSSFTATSGVLAYKPFPGRGVSTAVIGGGKEQLTRGLAVDVAPIRVNTISPGPIETPLLAAVAEKRSSAREEFAAASLLSRVGQVEDVSELYLATMSSGFITGTVIHVEGGYLLK